MPLNQVCLHLSHGVEHDAYDDQQAGAAEKLRRDHGHIQSLAQKTGQNRDERQENPAGKRESRHCEIEKIGSRFPRTHAWNVTAIFFKIVGDLSRLKLCGDPEVTEKENDRSESDVMRPAGRKGVGDAIRSGTALK